MSDKRPATTTDASGGQRQFKQTKLNFFTSASERQPKKPRTTPEEPQETATAAAKETSATAHPEDQQPPSQTETSKTKTAEQATTPQDPSPAPTPITTTPQTNPSSARLRITDRTGDLFAAPPSTLLIHACNTLGSWGGGIAVAFRTLYPDAFKVYRAHCARSTPDQLIGTALLIPPQNGRGKKHYIGCLFTSRRYGKARDPPMVILQATVPAMRHLVELVVAEEERTGVKIGEVRMCRINSGLFAVPWERSKRALEEMELGEGEVPGCVEGGVVEVVAWERE
ncbi:hypothetical protein C8A01DRAFT_49428 [Parachaetomium inaequale]|uniref:ADP-ribose 1''-phosphate phosphatase n=1 Tax=Parachaetomium inaequale TaxID=2588326 RepID=A0AAN6PB55_9PEZI|nr:hypothetical protein C8A01DRAFT_49428 [Parachaetomium inaequale]